MLIFYYAPALPPYTPSEQNESGGSSETYGAGIFTSTQIVETIGIDVDSTGINALNDLGIYPVIVPTVQPYNPQIWTITWEVTTEQVAADQNENHIAPHFNNFEEQSLDDIFWYNQAGEYARVEWGVLSKVDADLVDIGKRNLLRLGLKILRDRRSYSANNTWGFTDPTGGVVDTYWKDANNATLDYIQQKINTITSSSTSQEIDSIASPASGTVCIVRNEDNPNQIHTIEYKTFYGQYVSKFGTEFHFPATNTTLSYDLETGIQPGNTTLLSATDSRCQIRVASSGVIITELDLAEAEQMSLADYNSGYFDTYSTEGPYSDYEFGFHLYDFSDVSDYIPEIDVENLLDVAEIIRRHSEDPNFADALTVNTNARLRYDSSLTKLENVATTTSVDIGDSIALNTAATGFVVLDVANMTDAADDTAAAAAGVPVGGIYKTGSTLKIRVS